MSLRADVGQEAEPAAIHAEHRHRMRGREARGVQHRAVAADGDDQVRVRPRASPPAGARRGVAPKSTVLVALREDLAPAGVQMRREDLHRLDDARVAIVADQGDRSRIVVAAAGMGGVF